MDYGYLEGLINGTESLAFYRIVTGSAVSSIDTGAILNGDEDGWYTVIERAIGNGSRNYMHFNGDNTNSHYGRRGTYAQSTSVADASATTYTGIIGFTGSFTSGYTTFTVHKFYAKSGTVRLVNSVCAYDINGTTVNAIETSGSVWNNTVDNITSILFAGSYSVGSEIIILKHNNFTNGTPTGSITTPYIKGSWVRVGSQILGSAASSVTFSGLDGDRDVLYYMTAQMLLTGAAGYSSLTTQINSDAGAASYGYQYLRAVSTAASASRGTTDYYGTAGYGGQNAKYAQGSFLMFAKSGFIRPCIGQDLGNVTGTTVEALSVAGFSWNNTADNVTSITVVPQEAPTYNTGSQFELYALRPNG